ncbi:hypothetical protein HAPAU_17550 [Halalkalicoccus paucihalophilus]|uniref:Uncharacterized protein n=1 Tax=Halalkalicoccus paucihalophilus TaxID=1008153 RepID=A0A151AGD0_9EURY|nr:hypothetical protein [Halalkalicoccus paucihalophilus]KYH26655.1 hypothetical protein HAPAU_17550 [Halalkalicoccus paucihalophilus]
MGEKKTTLLEINIEDAGGFEFSPSPRFGGELAEKVEEFENKGSKLGLFGSKKAADEETGDDEEASSGLFSRESKESGDDAVDEESEATEVEVEDENGDEADAEGSGGSLGLVIGLLFLLVVAAVAKKFVAGGDVEEYEEVELSEYEN